MKQLTSAQIRQMYLDFFAEKQHQIIPSASLIPVNDPTLLWINAGVAPLKKYFDGTEVPDNRRLANVQKCIRTNDISYSVLFLNQIFRKPLMISYITTYTVKEIFVYML